MGYKLVSALCVASVFSICAVSNSESKAQAQTALVGGSPVTKSDDYKAFECKSMVESPEKSISLAFKFDAKDNMIVEFTTTDSDIQKVLFSYPVVVSNLGGELGVGQASPGAQNSEDMLVLGSFSALGDVLDAEKPFRIASGESDTMMLLVREKSQDLENRFVSNQLFNDLLGAGVVPFPLDEIAERGIVLKLDCHPTP